MAATSDLALCPGAARAPVASTAATAIETFIVKVWGIDDRRVELRDNLVFSPVGVVNL